jgi:hypothetical protein
VHPATQGKENTLMVITEPDSRKRPARYDRLVNVVQPQQAVTTNPGFITCCCLVLAMPTKNGRPVGFHHYLFEMNGHARRASNPVK